MGALDQYIPVNGSVPVSPDYHNELVDKLRQRNAPGSLIIEASTHLALVSPDATDVDAPYPLIPGTIVFSDETEWRGLTEDQVYLKYDLTGPGHLSASESGPGGVVQWGWHSAPEADALNLTDYTPRQWGADLPKSITITVTAYVLASRTHGPSLALKTGLAPLVAANGERRVVREDRNVYAYNPDATTGDVASDEGGYWVRVVGPSWVEHAVVQKNLVIERAYDPEFEAGINVRIVPEADYVRLEQGAAQVRVFDFSSFPGAISVVRHMSATFIDNDGEPTTADGITLPGGDALEWLSLSDKSMLLITNTSGRIRLTADYTIETEAGSVVRTYTRTITIGSAERGKAPSDTPPFLSRLRVVPGNGTCRFELGIPVTLAAFVQKGERTETSRPSDELRKSLSLRVSNNDLERVYAAAETLRSVLSSGTGTTIYIYEMQFTPADVSRLPELKNVEIGTVIYLPGGAVRILSVAVNAASITVQAEGIFNGEVGETGWVSSNADLIAVNLLFGYGTPNTASFPRKTFMVEQLLSPTTSLPAFDCVLPKAQPGAVTDGWYVRADAAAVWIGGDLKNESYEWQRAEAVPEGEPRLDVQRSGDAFEINLTGPMYEFYGSMSWQTAKDSMSRDDKDVQSVLNASGPVPTRFATALATSQYNENWVLCVEGHYRTAAGTCQPNLIRVSSQTFKPVGNPLIEAVDTPTCPETNGVFWKRNSVLYVSIGGMWMQLSATNSQSKLATVKRIDQNGLPQNVNGYATFETPDGKTFQVGTISNINKEENAP